MLNAPKGTKDILPDKIDSWLYIENKMRELCKLYGYNEIRTSIFEYTELFQRSIGNTTDVVDKEMYTFNDKSNRSITLRPENTASIIRAFIQNKLYTTNLNRFFYIGSMFRYDRPQAGRLREFYQCGIEILSEDSPMIDTEIIIFAEQFLKSLGLTDLKIKINSIGCSTCRSAYKQELLKYLSKYENDCCDDCKQRIKTNPLRILDCKICNNKEFIKDIPKITDYLCDNCKEHFDAVQKYLQIANTNFKIDSNLVRGLDYYSKTVFEIQYPLISTTIIGGGRYDGLVKELGGPSISGIGCAAGIERILLALEQ